MAGHSQFKNIMHRKGAQDAKRAKVFTKLIRELTVSAACGPDPETNPRLRAAILAARTSNMPKDTMERAIKRGAGEEDMSNYQEIRYEGYGPGGVAIIIEALTDNRNRTAPEIRSAFTKYNGSLGETNSVNFQFQHLGEIVYSTNNLTLDKIFELSLDAGAEDVESTDDFHHVYCKPEDLNHVREALTKHLGDPSSAKMVWKPSNLIQVDTDTAQSLLKLIDVLEDNDDVQSVFANFDIDPAILEKLN